MSLFVNRKCFTCQKELPVPQEEWCEHVFRGHPHCEPYYRVRKDLFNCKICEDSRTIGRKLIEKAGVKDYKSNSLGLPQNPLYVPYPGENDPVPSLAELKSEIDGNMDAATIRPDIGLWVLNIFGNYEIATAKITGRDLVKFEAIVEGMSDFMYTLKVQHEKTTYEKIPARMIYMASSWVIDKGPEWKPLVDMLDKWSKGDLEGTGGEGYKNSVVRSAYMVAHCIKYSQR